MPSAPSDRRRGPDCPSCGEAAPAGADFCPDCGAALDGLVTRDHCAECGAAFDGDDRFCSACGAPRSSAASRTEERGREPDRSAGEDGRGAEAATGESDRAFRRRVQDHLDAGWEIERDDGDRVVLVDRGIGAVGAHVLLLVFTGGLGNVLYGWWHYSTLAERRRIVRGDDAGTRPPSRAERGRRLESVSAVLLSALLLAVGGWIALLAVEAGSPPVGAVGLAFALLGAGAAPPVQRRLDRRHELSAVGRRKTVDHRTVRPPESVPEPCVVCGAAFDRGLVRRRRDETLVAGVPVRTHSVRHNHYCADCARSELFGDDPDSSAVVGDATDAAAESRSEPVREGRDATE